MELNKVWLIYWQSLVDLTEPEVVNVFSSFLKAENRVKELISEERYEYSYEDGVHRYVTYDEDGYEYTSYEISESEVL